ncbi:MAG: tryptophan synthase subunit alpha [Candidatus Bathyarchaeota archaeon]|nr:tryptophan synthase subunit alpha [Candidatus Bathyarchaeota archaeon]
MSIKDVFRRLDKHSEGALIAYVTGGDPTPKHTPMIIEALVNGGADIIEIGIPFSDPIADGPIIQAAGDRALKAGTTPHTILKIVNETKKKVDVPIVLLTYFNILFKTGVDNFLKIAHRYGVDGLIIPDLPIEEAENYREYAHKQSIDTIFLATPATSKNRLENIIDFTSGFLYLVSVFGITGTRERLDQLTTNTIKKFKPFTSKSSPLAVGFGISKSEHVRSVINNGADGAIVGSAFVKIIENNLNNSSKLLSDISNFAMSLKSATITKNQ